MHTQLNQAQALLAQAMRILETDIGVNEKAFSDATAARAFCSALGEVVSTLHLASTDLDAAIADVNAE